MWSRQVLTKMLEEKADYSPELLNLQVEQIYTFLRDAAYYELSDMSASFCNDLPIPLDWEIKLLTQVYFRLNHKKDFDKDEILDILIGSAINTLKVSNEYEFHHIQQLVNSFKSLTNRHLDFKYVELSHLSAIGLQTYYQARKKTGIKINEKKAEIKPAINETIDMVGLGKLEEILTKYANAESARLFFLKTSLLYPDESSDKQSNIPVDDLLILANKICLQKTNDVSQIQGGDLDATHDTIKKETITLLIAEMTQQILDLQESINAVTQHSLEIPLEMEKDSIKIDLDVETNEPILKEYFLPIGVFKILKDLFTESDKNQFEKWLTNIYSAIEIAVEQLPLIRKDLPKIEEFTLDEASFKEMLANQFNISKEVADKILANYQHCYINEKYNHLIQAEHYKQFFINCINHDPDLVTDCLTRNPKLLREIIKHEPNFAEDYNNSDDPDFIAVALEKHPKLLTALLKDKAAISQVNVQLGQYFIFLLKSDLKIKQQTIDLYISILQMKGLVDRLNHLTDLVPIDLSHRKQDPVSQPLSQSDLLKKRFEIKQAKETSHSDYAEKRLAKNIKKYGLIFMQELAKKNAQTEEPIKNNLPKKMLRTKNQ